MRWFVVAGGVWAFFRALEDAEMFWVSGERVHLFLAGIEGVLVVWAMFLSLGW